MKDQVKLYFDEYISLLKRTKVTGFKGYSIPFDKGIQQTISILSKSIAKNGKIMFIGNGGSAAIASHFALDFWHAAAMRSISFNDGPQLTCLGNDHGYGEVFTMPIKMFGTSSDVLVAISSSGASFNILNGVKMAREILCNVITFSGFDSDNQLRKLGDLNFYVPARHYGHVESVHAAILHCILDLKKETNSKKNPSKNKKS